jgi:hypothetical protein
VRALASFPPPNNLPQSLVAPHRYPTQPDQPALYLSRTPAALRCPVHRHALPRHSLVGLPRGPNHAVCRPSAHFESQLILPPPESYLVDAQEVTPSLLTGGPAAATMLVPLPGDDSWGAQRGRGVGRREWVRSEEWASGR